MASEFPQSIPIPPSTHKKLMEINERMGAVQQSIQMFQHNCEQRLAQLQAEGRQVWAGIRQDTGIDMDNVVWEAHPTEFKIVPMQVRLKRG